MGGGHAKNLTNPAFDVLTQHLWADCRVRFAHAPCEGIVCSYPDPPGDIIVVSARVSGLLQKSRTK